MARDQESTTLGLLEGATAEELDRGSGKVPISARAPADGRISGEAFVNREARNTPLLPEAPPQAPTHLRATLTLITGVRAGQFVATAGAPVTVGRAADADLVIDDMGVSRHHVRVGRTADVSFVAEDLGSTNGTFLGSHRIGVALLKEGDLLQLGPNVQVRFAVVDSREESLRRRLYESSMHDPLTHVFNRRYLSDRLLAEIAHARRSGGDLGLLMIDVDGLKQVNDLYGHLAGDRALSTIAARIMRVLRTEDMLARYGGDEFVVLALGSAGSALLPLAERIRSAVADLHMSARGREVRITASIGLASLAEIDDANEDAGEELIALADARMYAAKSSGKNRVCVRPPPPVASSSAR